MTKFRILLTRIHPRGGGAPFEKLELAFRNEPPKPGTTSRMQGSGVINSSAAGSTYGSQRYGIVEHVTAQMLNTSLPSLT